MTNRELFIETVKSLFDEDVRKITTDPYKAGQEYKFVIPLNNLVLIDGCCGSKTILEHKDITKYIIVSANKLVFNGLEYSVVYIILDTPKRSSELYTVLSNSNTLALYCGKGRQQILPVGGDTNFIDTPNDFHLTRYAKTSQEGVYIRQDLALDITSKLNISIQNSQIIVTPKNTQPSQ